MKAERRSEARKEKNFFHALDSSSITSENQVFSKNINSDLLFPFISQIQRKEISEL
jgi:hypothetical protein